MDRDIWLEGIHERKVPPWPCPTCTRGNLAVVKKTWRDIETVASKSNHSHRNWDPEWIDYVFVVQLKCGSDKCGELAELIGNGGVEASDDDGALDFVEIFRPLFLYPMPEIIRIPHKSHIEIKFALRKSFASFWANPAGAASSVRIAVENLLEQFGFPEKAPASKGRSTRKTLHQRLKAFGATYPVLGAQLMAVKWLGNSGAHSSRISPGDVLDAYEVLEDCLAELVDQRSTRVATLAKELSNRHGSK